MVGQTGRYDGREGKACADAHMAEVAQRPAHGRAELRDGCELGSLPCEQTVVAQANLMLERDIRNC